MAAHATIAPTSTRLRPGRPRLRLFEEIIHRPVPVDMAALRLLVKTKSPLAIDLYQWLTFRMSYLRQPLTIPWPRLELETRAKKGVVVVRYDGCEMKLLPHCNVSNNTYGFEIASPTVDTVTITNADELWANMPIGAAKLEGKLATAGVPESAIFTSP